MRTTRTDMIVWVTMAVFAVVTLFLVSADSWTHCLYDHYDSATFFASGKAWMSGMVPYVDFSDSKGPLLWLIYGVGYLLSPRTMHGVFWITCLCYSIIFWWLYKTAFIYLKNNRLSIVASVTTAVSIFFPMVRYETRAEDFALFFLVWALYHVCCLLHDTDVNARRQIRRASIVLGVGMAATLLIKYNVSAMLGVMALFVLHYAWRAHYGIWRSLGWMALASALFLIPFLLYMLAVGCFDEFIHEYFVVNMEVVSRQHAQMGQPIFLLIKHRYTVGIYLLLNAVSAFAMLRLNTRYRAFVPVIFTVVVMLTVSNAFWLYYYAMCAIFLCFGVVALFHNHIKLHRISPLFIAPYSLFIILVVLSIHLAWGGSWWFKGKAEQKAYDDYVRLMSRVERPRIIYYNTCTSGFGIPVESLPGCKYWTSQSGATQLMDDDQLRAIINREADFVFSLKAHDNPALFDSLGYHRYGNSSALPMLLYAR